MDLYEQDDRTDMVLNQGGSVFGQGAYDAPTGAGGGDSSGGSSVTVSPNLGQPAAQPTFSREVFSRVELTHGVMATMAFAAFFPLGAIAIRTVPGRLALLAHLALQFLAYAFFTAAVGMGIWMAHVTEPFGTDWVSFPPVVLLLFRC